MMPDGGAMTLPRFDRIAFSLSYARSSPILLWALILAWTPFLYAARLT